MKNYTEMTADEISKIVNRGGDQKRQLTKMVADHLDSLNLSEAARDAIVNTDLNSLAEVFGGLLTAEEVERYVSENF